MWSREVIDCTLIRGKIKMADACTISARRPDFADREGFINQPRVQRRLHKLMRLGCRAEACAFSLYIVPGRGLIDNELAHRLRYQQISRRTSVFKAHTGRGSRRGWPPADILYLLHIAERLAGCHSSSFDASIHTSHRRRRPWQTNNAQRLNFVEAHHIFFLKGLKMRNAHPLWWKMFWCDQFSWRNLNYHRTVL
jgi:hypothetical protein